MRPELRSLIRDYQAQVSEACQLLHERLNLSGNLIRSWGTKAVPQAGWLDVDQTSSYFFHGIGCHVETPTINVEFDFGFDGLHGGFDAGRLAFFARNTPRYSEFSDSSFFHYELTKLLDAGELIQLWGLFYFADTNTLTNNA